MNRRAYPIIDPKKMKLYQNAREAEKRLCIFTKKEHDNESFKTVAKLLPPFRNRPQTPPVQSQLYVNRI